VKNKASIPSPSKPMSAIPPHIGWENIALAEVVVRHT
jgi:hypothetical protein